MSLTPEKIKDSLLPLLTIDQSISLQITLKNYDIKKDVRFDINHPLPHAKRQVERILILCDKNLLSIVESKYPKFNKEFLTNYESIKQYGGVSYLPFDEIKDKRTKKKLARWHHSLISVPNFNKFFEMRIVAAKNVPIYTIKNVAEIETLVNELKTMVKIRMRKGVNVDFCVGNSALTSEQLAENVVSCVNALAGSLKRGVHNLKSVYVKGTRGKAVKII